jgi:hypothetical protein
VQVFVLHGNEHIGAHAINEIRKWTKVPGERITVVKVTSREPPQFRSERFVLAVREVYFEIHFGFEFKLQPTPGGV